MINKAFILSIILFVSARYGYATNDPYREFLACVDEILDNNTGMNPKVAEEICHELLDKVVNESLPEEICELFVKKRK